MFMLHLSQDTEWWRNSLLFFTNKEWRNGNSQYFHFLVAFNKQVLENSLLQTVTIASLLSSRRQVWRHLITSLYNMPVLEISLILYSCPLALKCTTHCGILFDLNKGSMTQLWILDIFSPHSRGLQKQAKEEASTGFMTQILMLADRKLNQEKFNSVIIYPSVCNDIYTRTSQAHTFSS